MLKNAINDNKREDASVMSRYATIPPIYARRMI